MNAWTDDQLNRDALNLNARERAKPFHFFIHLDWLQRFKPWHDLPESTPACSVLHINFLEFAADDFDYFASCCSLVRSRTPLNLRLLYVHMLSMVRRPTAVPVCDRCRQRRQKCDQSLLGCGPCKTAKVECTFHDPEKGITIPRT